MFNLHTHTYYCDGKGKPEQYIHAAIDKKFKTLGFSSHAPLPFRYGFEMIENKLPEYCEQINILKLKYQNQINVHLSLEIDFIPGQTRDFDFFQSNFGLDYTIGAIHLVKNSNNGALWFIEGADSSNYDEGLQRAFNGNIKNAVSTYYSQLIEMVITQKPNIIAHLDKVVMHNRNRYFNPDERWYQRLIDESMHIIQQSGCIVEVNTRGIYKGKSESLFPDIPLLKKIKTLHIPVTISTDSHHPEEINLYWNETRDILLKLGFKEVFSFKNNNFEAIPLKAL